MPAYVRKKTLNPGRKIEYIHARMVGKFSDVQFGICFLTRMWDICWESGVKYLRLSKDVKLKFVFCSKVERKRG